MNKIGTAAIWATVIAASSSSAVQSSTSFSSNYLTTNAVLHRIGRGGDTLPNPESDSNTTAHPHNSADNISHASTSASMHENPKVSTPTSSKKKKSRSSSTFGHHTPSDSTDTKSKSQTSHDSKNLHNEKGDHQTSADSATPTPIQSYISSEKDLYHILGLHQQPRSSITPTDIQKAYRRRCLLTHPDKVPNGDRAAFDKVTEAFTILSDDNKRSLYDRFGLDAVQQQQEGNGAFSASGGMSSGGLGEELFRQFFGGHPSMDGMRFFHQSSSSSRRQQTKPQNRNLRYQLEISLEAMYTGSHQTVTISLPMSKSKKELDVTIPRGIAHGQSIRLPGMVDSISDSTPADVIFVIVQRQHPIFTRKAHDLAMEVTLSLSEALTGFERTIIHLDGRKICVRGPMVDGSSTTPRIIQSGDVHVLKGQGMPKRQKIQNLMNIDLMDEKDRCDMYGDLYIQYKIELPSSISKGKKNNFDGHLTNEERSTLRRLLSKLQGSNPVQLDTKDQVHTLKTASSSDFGRESGSIESLEAEEDQETEDDSFRQGFQYFSPMGSARSGFFSSSTASTDENGNVQCQQM